MIRSCTLPSFNVKREREVQKKDKEFYEENVLELFNDAVDNQQTNRALHYLKDVMGVLIDEVEELKSQASAPAAKRSVTKEKTADAEE
jgi:ribosomal protein L12E/L44/L45/RPP1/RPP2